MLNRNGDEIFGCWWLELVGPISVSGLTGCSWGGLRGVVYMLIVVGSFGVGRRRCIYGCSGGVGSELDMKLIVWAEVRDRGSVVSSLC